MKTKRRKITNNRIGWLSQQYLLCNLVLCNSAPICVVLSLNVTMTSIKSLLNSPIQYHLLSLLFLLFHVCALIILLHIQQNLHVNNHLICNIYNMERLHLSEHLLQNANLYQTVLYVYH
jgi:hypothetical protein